MPLSLPSWRKRPRPSRTRPGVVRRLVLACGALCAAATAPAAIVQFSQTSSPAGLFASSTTFPESGTSVTTLAAPAASSTYSFAYWTLNGTRAADAYGQALNPTSFTILEPTAAVAVYLPTTQDSDGDGLQDWFEYRYFGNLVQNASSDGDNDGLTLAVEQTRGYSPLFANTLPGGGLSRRRSPLALSYIAPISGNVTLTTVSQPAGLVAGASQTVATWTSVALPSVPATVSGHHFTGWLVNGIRIDNALQAQPAFLTVEGPTTAVARYIIDTADTDADGIADWFEYLHTDTLAHAASFDGDGDGYDFATEFVRGFPPALPDSFDAGGLSRRRAPRAISLNLAGLIAYHFQSNPAGLVSIQDAAPVGALIVSPDLWNTTISGQVFAYWEIDGVPQADPATGGALSQLHLTLATPLTATARFLPPDSDTDSDGVADWYEFRHCAGLSFAADSDTDADGLTLRQEQERASSPVFADLIAQGGLSRRREAGHTIINLQFFERLRRVLRDGLLTELFSPVPTALTGQNFGADSAPALGDWDGDGDLDLFVASPFSLTVFENIGTRFTLNLGDRSTAFTGLAALASTLSLPAPALGDWDGDDRDDLVLGGDTGLLRFVRSAGSFTDPAPASPAFTLDTASASTAPTIGDFTGDGAPDLLVLLADGTARLYPHSGDPAPFSATNFVDDYLGVPVTQGVALACGDLDGDGRLDVVASDLDGRLWEFHRNASGEGFTLTSKVWAGAGNGFAPRLAISLADFDGDGDTDAVGATHDGALVGLRDPRVGRPSGLVLTSGARSIALSWDPDRQARIKGYQVYRADAADAPFELINPSPLAVPEYTDADVTRGSTYFYRVTGLTEAYLPGNSLPRVVESPPSETLSQTAGVVSLAVRPAHANFGNIVRLRLAIANPFAVSGVGLQLKLLYDPAVLTPLTQTNPLLGTVGASAISRDLAFSNNGATANGELVISGSGGALNPGAGTLFVLRFRVAPTAPEGTTASVVLSQATVRDTSGNLLAWESTQSGPLTVGANYSEGDLTGDGVIDHDDSALLIDLLKLDARAPSDDELIAGDLNANGDLDLADLVLLKRLLNELPLE